MSFQPVKVYLSLGSNMGDREGNLARGIQLLGERMRLGKVSSKYETDPVGNTNQPRFINMACEIYTTLPPAGLLTALKGIELKMGRTSGTGEPRPIDIDIILYGEQVIETPDLVVPHREFRKRAFVLVPLAEIAPDVVDPVTHKAVKDLAKAVSEQGVTKLAK